MQTCDFEDNFPSKTSVTLSSLEPKWLDNSMSLPAYLGSNSEVQILRRMSQTERSARLQMYGFLLCLSPRDIRKDCSPEIMH